MAEGPDVVREPLPLTRSVLWKPVTASGPGSIPDPIFVMQAVIAAVRDHASSAPDQGVLGFLTGCLCESPDAELRYVRVDAAIRATHPVQDDRTTVAVNALWDRVRAEVRKTGAQLLGWYHTHAEPGIALSSYDVETHERYFRDAWQFALVVGSEDGQVAAGVYRAGPDENWRAACLPFFEVAKDEESGGGEKKRSYVVWKNYRAYSAASFAPSPPAAPAEPDVEAEEELEEREVDDEREMEAEPEESGERESELRFLSAAEDTPPPAPPSPRVVPRRTSAPHAAPPPPPPPSPPRGSVPEAAPAAPRRASVETPSVTGARRAPVRPIRRPRRRWSWARVFGLAVVLLLVPAGGALYWRFGPTRRTTTAPPPRHRAPRGIPAPATPALARLDGLADSLAQAVRNYDDRGRLFDKRQLDCLGLGRGLAAVEGRLILYDVQYVPLRAALDVGRAARDRDLRGGVDSAEARFRRSQCRHP